MHGIWIFKNSNVPHSSFTLGHERTVAWFFGVRSRTRNNTISTPAKSFISLNSLYQIEGKSLAHFFKQGILLSCTYKYTCYT